MRIFDEEHAKAIVQGDYTSVGFDNAVRAILEYNESAAAFVDNTDNAITTEQAQAYIGFVETNSTNIKSLISGDHGLVNLLRAYMTDYAAWDPETNANTADYYNNTVLAGDYNRVVECLDNIAACCDNIKELFGEFPDLTEFIPQQVRVSQ